jgi:hypothetical protein
VSRHMRTDQMTLDTSGFIVLQAPEVLSAQELVDVREWFDMKCRRWERRVMPQEKPPTGKEKE